MVCFTFFVCKRSLCWYLSAHFKVLAGLYSSSEDGFNYSCHQILWLLILGWKILIFCQQTAFQKATTENEPSWILLTFTTDTLYVFVPNKNKNVRMSLLFQAFKKEIVKTCIQVSEKSLKIVKSYKIKWNYFLLPYKCLVIMSVKNKFIEILLVNS